MRIVMMATGDIALPSFQALLETGNLVALYTQPDRPVGRHQVLTPPEVKKRALAADIPVYQPEQMKAPEAIAQLEALQADILVVMAYGQILTQAVIDAPRLACINVHASLLPRHRGASCLQAAIEAGDDETGVTIMHVVKKLDAGDIISKCSIPLDGTETAESLHDQLAALSPSPLLQAIAQLSTGNAPREAQDDKISTYAPKLLRSHGEIDWTQPAFQIARKIRAYHSWPGTYTLYPSKKSQSDKVLKIYPPIEVYARHDKSPDTPPGTVLAINSHGMVIACGGPYDGAILIQTLQPAGARKMNAESFFAGHRIDIGTILGGSSSENK